MLLKELFRFAAQRKGDRYSAYTVKTWVRISITLQLAVVQSIPTLIIVHHPSLGEHSAPRLEPALP
jgi:hypothetical protein